MKPSAKPVKTLPTHCLAARIVGPVASLILPANGMSSDHLIFERPSPSPPHGIFPPSLAKTPPTLPTGTTEMTARIVSSQCFFQKSTWKSGSKRLSTMPIAVGTATLPSCLPMSTQSTAAIAVPSFFDRSAPWPATHAMALPRPSPRFLPSLLQSTFSIPPDTALRIISPNFCAADFGGALAALMSGAVRPEPPCGPGTGVFAICPFAGATCPTP